MELCFCISSGKRGPSKTVTEAGCGFDFDSWSWIVWCFSAKGRLLFFLFLALTRLKVPGRERTESRTRTATRTSSKTAARCSVGQHTRGNFFLQFLINAASVPVIDHTTVVPPVCLNLANTEKDAVSGLIA